MTPRKMKNIPRRIDSVFRTRGFAAAVLEGDDR